MGWGLVPEFKSQREWLGNNVFRTGHMWKSINAIWDVLNVEIKHHDYNATATQVTTTPQLIGLTEITQGITGNSPDIIDTGYRDGDKLRVKSINIKGELRNAASETVNDICTVMLIKHYDNFLGNAPLFNDMYDQNTNNELHLRLRVREHLGQYRILARRQFVLTAGGTDQAGLKIFNMYWKPRRRKHSVIEWEGSASSDPSNGKYYLVVFSDSASDNPTLQFSARTTYVDN